MCVIAECTYSKYKDVQNFLLKNVTQEATACVGLMLPLKQT